MTDEEFLCTQVHILALTLDHAIEACKIAGVPSDVIASLQRVVTKVRENVAAN